MSERMLKTGEKREYFPETKAIIERLREDPTTAFGCAHGETSPALAIYEVPRGCVALPGLQTQPLCGQHVMTDGSFEGMNMVVDLTVGGAWSKQRSETPDFYIGKTPEGFELVEGTPPTDVQ